MDNEIQAPDVLMIGAGGIELLFYSGLSIQPNTETAITVPIVSTTRLFL